MLRWLKWLFSDDPIEYSSAQDVVTAAMLVVELFGIRPDTISKRLRETSIYHDDVLEIRLEPLGTVGQYTGKPFYTVKITHYEARTKSVINLFEGINEYQPAIFKRGQWMIHLFQLELKARQVEAEQKRLDHEQRFKRIN